MATGVALTIAVFALVISIGNSRLCHNLKEDVERLQSIEEKRMKAIFDAISKTLRERNSSLQ